MATVAGLAVVLPVASTVVTSLMGTLSGGIGADNFTFNHFIALLTSRAMRFRRWGPAFRWRWPRR
nr:Ferric iron ABC transporter [Raoultella sp. NCTC 9187]